MSQPDPSKPETTPTPDGLQLGELLIAQGVLTARQVAHVLDVQAVSPRPFGDLAERLFGVDPKLVAGAWVKQFVARHAPRDGRGSTKRRDLSPGGHAPRGAVSLPW